MTKWTRIVMIMVVVVILLVIVSGVARIVLNHAEGGSLPLEIVVWATSFLIGLIALGAVILAIWKGAAWFLNQLRLSDIEEEVAGDPDVAETAHTMERLEGILVRVEQNREEAQERILDIFMLTTELVGLVEAISRKMRDLDGELNALDLGLAALRDQQPEAIAEAAGMISDPHISRLMLNLNTNPTSRVQVINLVATQAGAHNARREALAHLTEDWLTAIAGYKANLAQLSVTVDAVDGVRPVALIEKNLAEAHDFLVMRGDFPSQRMLRAASTLMLTTRS